METWERSRWQTKRRALKDLPDESLWRGDVFRFPFHPSLGPGSKPVEMLLFEAWGFDDVLGLVPISGYKAGLPHCYFPKDSQGDNRLTLETSRLHKNWGDWLVYQEWCDKADDIVLLPMPIDETFIIRRSSPAPNLKL